MIYIPDEIILVRMMTASDLQIMKAIHYHNEGYDSDNDYGLLPCVMRPIDIYLVFTTRASFDLAEFITTQHLIPPLTPRCPRSLPFWEGVCQCLAFKEMPLATEEDSDDKEDVQTADLDDPVWSKEPVPDSQGYLCIHEIPRPAITPNQPLPQPIPTTPPPQLNQELPVTPSPQPDQVKMPLDYELMDLDILEDIPDLLDVPEHVMCDFDAWVQDVLSYQF